MEKFFKWTYFLFFVLPSFLSFFFLGVPTACRRFLARNRTGATTVTTLDLQSTRPLGNLLNAHIFNFLGSISRNEMAGTYGKPLFNF